MAILKVRINNEWVDIPAIVGPQGIPGPSGPPGEQGETGETGPTGKGIFSFEKTGTSGLTSTYTMTYTDGSWIDIQVTDGNGIESIEKTGTSGNVDTYTITFTDGTTTTFNVTNGNAVIDDTAGDGDTTKVWSADKSDSELSTVKNALQETAQESTGQELLAVLVAETLVTESLLGVAGNIIDHLPQDESGTDIRDALALEADRLSAIYDLWYAEKEGA